MPRTEAGWGEGQHMAGCVLPVSEQEAGGERLSEAFDTDEGVRQGSVLSPSPVATSATSGATSGEGLAHAAVDAHVVMRIAVRGPHRVPHSAMDAHLQLPQPAAVPPHRSIGTRKGEERQIRVLAALAPAGHHLKRMINTAAAGRNAACSSGWRRAHRDALLQLAHHQPIAMPG